MPLIDLTTTMDDVTPVVLGLHHGNDADEMYLKRLSVHASVRQDDLKHGVSRQNKSYTSLTDLLHQLIADDEDKQNKDTCSQGDLVEVGLKEHEQLVKGFEIDRRILPGFRYTIRKIATDEFIFNGDARRLESIGLGYGRRMTFQGDRLNFNDCVFWSDSEPEGYAFSVEAVKYGDTFTIVDSQSQSVGEVEIQNVEFPQTELDTVIEGTNIRKNVRVRFACSIKQFHHQLALVNVTSQDFEIVEGIAELIKVKGNKDASVTSISGVIFQNLGNCSLHAE